MIATLISGHDDLSDWCFLLALVALVASAALVVVWRTDRPSDGRTAGNRAVAVRVLALVGAALVALGWLVL